ncbi:MAG: hypothetical protein RL662_2381 [Bacteroidota bacterium]|jgi:hypothetical protein
MLYIIDNTLLTFDEKSSQIVQSSTVNDIDHLIASGAKVVTNIEFNIIKRKSEAWNVANAFGEQLDNNARVSMLYLLMDPACPVWRKERILAVQSWWGSLWAEYARVIKLIADEENGLVEGYTFFDSTLVGQCPYNIWQITNE